MVNKYTKKEMISKQELNEMYAVKNMTYKEISNEKGISIKIIQNRIKQYEIIPRRAIKRNFKREKCNFWKGGKMILNGYIYILSREHPRATARGYVSEHMLIMENHLGRKLKYFGFNNSKNEVVHHINFNKKDNRIENLKLMTFGEHVSLHSKGKKYKNGKREN